MDNKVTIKVDVDGSGAKSGFQDMRTESDKIGEQISRAAGARLRDAKGKFTKGGEESGKGFSDGFSKKGNLLDFGKKIGNLLDSDIMGGVEKASKTMPQALAAGALLASPFIGATISAAVIGGVSIGAAGIGVALAAQDPRVKAAGSAWGKQIKAGLIQDSAGFIGPVLTQIDKVGMAFERQRPRIRSIFNDSAGFLDPLVDGAMRGIDGILGGVEKLVHNGGPVIEAFSELFADVGGAIGDAMGTISGGSDDAAKAVGDLSLILSGTVRVVGLVVRGLTEAYGVLRKPIEPVFELAKKMGILDEAQEKVATSAPPAAEAVGGVGTAADQAITPLMTMAEKMNLVNEAGGNLYDSQISVEEALDNVTQSIKDNGKGLDINTEKGRNNATSLSTLAKRLIDNYEGYVKVNGEGPKADGVMTRNRQSFINAAIAAGKSKTAAAAFATQLGLLPVAKSVKIDAKTAAAMEDARELRRAIDNIRGKTVTVRVRNVITTNNAGDEAQHGSRASGGLVGAAGGGIRSSMTMVGEHGPELVQLPPGSRVNSNEDTMRMMSGGRGGGWGTIEVPIYLDGREIARAIADPMRRLVGDNFGGSVQAAYGS